MAKIYTRKPLRTRVRLYWLKRRDAHGEISLWTRPWAAKPRGRRFRVAKIDWRGARIYVPGFPTLNVGATGVHIDLLIDHVERVVAQRAPCPVAFVRENF